MVEVASPAPVSVGLVAWPRHLGAATVVVKTSYDVRADGSVVPSMEAAPLSLDVRAADGTILYPSDFAPFKPSPEVIVVGDEAQRTEMIGKLGVGGAQTASQHLGPIESHDARDTGWDEQDFHFARFQSARPEQRGPLTAQLQLSFVRGQVSCAARLPLSPPAVVVAQRAVDGSLVEQLPVQLACDTVLFEPRARRLFALFRGYAEPVGGWSQRTVILCNPLGGLPGLSAVEVATWARSVTTSPEDVARSQETHEDDDEMSATASTGRSPAYVPAPSFGRPPEPIRTARFETVAAVQGMGGAALPFVAGGPSPPLPIARSRSSSMLPAASERDPEPSSQRSMGRETLPLHGPNPVQAYFSARVSPSQRPTQTVAIPQLSRDQIERIQRELAVHPLARAEVLDRYSLTEMLWSSILGSTPPSQGSGR